MKNALMVSILINAGLVMVILWGRAEHKAELHESALRTMRADEQYIDILDQTLEAIASPESVSSKTTVQLVRDLVAAGKVNMELRRRAGLDL